jgi:hypothetical protein
MTGPIGLIAPNASAGEGPRGAEVQRHDQDRLGFGDTWAAPRLGFGDAWNGPREPIAGSTKRTEAAPVASRGPGSTVLIAAVVAAMLAASVVFAIERRKRRGVRAVA